MSTELAQFRRELRSNYGPAYDSGKRAAFGGYHGALHWENEWRWRQSAEGLDVAFVEAFGEHPTSVLELGCGTGAMTAELRARGLSAWGMDWGNNIQHEGGLVADALAIPFRRRFDLVVALDLVEHVPMDLQAKLFEELRRVSGRALIVTVPTEEPHYWLGSADGMRNHYISCAPDRWREHFALHGFEVLQALEELVLIGAPFAWGDTNYPFMLRRCDANTAH